MVARFWVCCKKNRVMIAQLQCVIHTDASLSVPRRSMTAGIVVTIGEEVYRMALTAPFIPCSMSAEAWAAWQGVRYAKDLLCGASVPIRHYTDCSGLVSAIRKPKQGRSSSFYRVVDNLAAEVEGLDWRIGWRSRKHPMMREPHALAASVI